MPVQKFRYATAELDGRIYIAGGEIDGGFSDAFLCFDTTVNKWTKKQPIQLQSTNAILFKSNRLLYAIGAASILNKYDPEEEKWTEVCITWNRI